MKTKYLLPAILIVMLSACNSKPKEQELVDDPEITPSTSIASTNTHKKGFKTNIEKDAVENSNYRKVLYTSSHMQLVLMSLKPGEEIGSEVHLKSDQFFRIESGNGKCIVNGTEYELGPGDVVVVPVGAEHNVINTDAKADLKLYTIYAEPNHKDGVIRATKKEAEEKEAKFDGKVTEQ